MRKNDQRRVISVFIVFFFVSFVSPVNYLPAAEPAAAEAAPAATSGDSNKISLDFDNTPVKDVLKFFSQQSGMNFIANKDIETKTVTVYFENVSAKDALDSIMTANNLSYYQEEGSNIYVVYSADTKTPRLQTKVFRLKYARLSTSPIDVAGHRTITDLLSSDIPKTTAQTSVGGGGSPTSSGTPSKQSFVQKGIDQLLSSLLSPEGSLTIDLPTNSVIVTDNPERLRRIENVLKQLDVPQPQVILEVYVMEVKKDLLDNIGVEWGGADGTLFNASGASLSTGYPFTSGLFKKALGNKIVPYATPSNLNTPGGLTTGLLDAGNLSAVLHFIKTQTDTKILAQPRLLTQNNEAATIRLITNQGISISSVTVANATNPVTTATIERAELGISLKMTPQIDEDDSIQLFVEPAVSTGVPNTFLTGVGNVLDPTTRIVRTVARVKDRQTLIIGGLMDSSRQEQQRKMPFLGEVPLIGSAFRYDTHNNTNREILIFITPRILKDYGSADDKAVQKNITAKKMMDYFMTDQIDTALDAAEAANWQNASSSFPQKKNKPVPPKNVAPSVGKEMDHTLDLLNAKNARMGR